MLKKVFSVVLCVVLTCTMLSAFAVTANDISTTTVLDTETNLITVKTTVANASSGTTYTYLAHDAEADLDNLAVADIVYVDEKTADGTTVSFDYTTDTDKIGSQVRVSGVAGDTLPTLVPDDNCLVSFDGGDTGTSCYVTLTGDVDAYVLVPADLGASKVDGVTVDGTDVDYFVGANGVWIKESNFGDTMITVAITTGETANAYVKTEGLGIIAADNIDSDGAAAVIACAQVLGNVDSFGIEFSNNVNFSSTGENDVLWTAKALGKGSNGRFAVKVAKYATVMDADATVYARAYYVVDGVTSYGATWSVTPETVVAD